MKEAPEGAATPRQRAGLVTLVTGVGLLIFSLAGLFVMLRPAPDPDLRTADGLFSSGRYYEALAAYGELAPDMPVAQLRMGMLYTLRAERAPAERAIRSAMQRGLAPTDYHLGLLYLGKALADAGQTAAASRTWALVDHCLDPAACAYRGPAVLLTAEQALRQGDQQAAATGYHTALAEPLPAGWAERAQYGLALIEADNDAQVALEWLNTPTGATTADPLLAPLLSLHNDEPARLAAVLLLDEPDRPLLLGQLYLELDLDTLAAAQFARVDPHGSHGLSAAAYAAYTRWRLGETDAGQSQLEALVAEHPDEPRIRAMLALIYLAADADAAAQTQLEVVARLRPADADTQLAWASWYAAQHEYAQASLAYAQALRLAPEAQAGTYALLAARFHLATTYELCSEGLPLAELAAGRLPDDPVALTTLAAQRYHCEQFSETLEAAQAARQAGAGAEATYYLGMALGGLGRTEEARAALISAADMEPASDWRRRAELALERLPAAIERRYTSSK